LNFDSRLSLLRSAPRSPSVNPLMSVVVTAAPRSGWRAAVIGAVRATLALL
jgi:hypothetical protein